jgi:hypothetical protein
MHYTAGMYQMHIRAHTQPLSFLCPVLGRDCHTQLLAQIDALANNFCLVISLTPATVIMALAWLTTADNHHSMKPICCGV